jgi:hypothetical protein
MAASLKVIAQGPCSFRAIFKIMFGEGGAAAPERPGFLYVYRFSRMFGCRMMSSREPRSPRGHAEGMVKTG